MVLGGGLVLRRSFWASCSSRSSWVVSSSFLWNTSASVGTAHTAAATLGATLSSKRLWGEGYQLIHLLKRDPPTTKCCPEACSVLDGR